MAPRPALRRVDAARPTRPVRAGLWSGTHDVISTAMLRGMNAARSQ
jgi:hypothetical protein